jgi:hypothetical protein
MTIMAASKVKVHRVYALVLPDEDPDPSYLDQERFEERREAYERGDFHFVGVRAVADIEVGGVNQEIASGGLWGIESDSGDDYFATVAKDEYDQLVDILGDLGVKHVPSLDKKVRHT